MREKTKSILITGFEPFAEHQTNISQDIANAFAGKVTTFEQNNCSYELNWQTEILSVDEQGSAQIANMLSQKPNAFHAIIQCGLCENCEHIHIETKARNRLDMRVADNAGRFLEGTVIIPDAPQELLTSIDLEALHLESFPYAKISDDAGAYVCNETYFRTLWACKNAKQSIPLIFVHLPFSNIVAFAEQEAFIQKLGESFLTL
ncbi:MAG: hypothetical protein QGI45_00405 [Myxococcota bacterium]|jgi:pyroglutamyl-peptidase|nr:hypothetical protein [Myxococcota bacterium]